MNDFDVDEAAAAMGRGVRLGLTEAAQVALASEIEPTEGE
jgi:hypothetical protein